MFVILLNLFDFHRDRDHNFFKGRSSLLYRGGGVCRVSVRVIHICTGEYDDDHDHDHDDDDVDYHYDDYYYDDD